MSDQTCDCCGANRTQTTDGTNGSEAEPSVDRWIGDASVMATPLPDDVQTAMEQLVGGGSITTLADWVAALRRQTGGAIDFDDLCHVDDATDHWGELDGTRYDFRCFYDAVALAQLASQPVEIRTKSPDGTSIEARATGDGDVTATPSTAAVSFGVAPAAVSADDAPTLEDAYAAICPTVRAFPTRSAYERWAAQTSAATVGMPLSAATTVAAGLVEE